VPDRVVDEGLVAVHAKGGRLQVIFSVSCLIQMPMCAHSVEGVDAGVVSQRDRVVPV